MSNSPQRKKYFTAAEAADLLMVSPVTVRKWAQKGALPSVSTFGGHRRFVLTELKRFAEQHGIRVADSAEPGVATERSRILLVDDDSIFTEYVREIVLRASPGATVECAADGFEAGKLSETLRPQLVVMDINMPGIGGIELCRRLRANPTTAGARLVVMSGEMTAENAAAARAAGADACLAKGSKRAEILSALAITRPRDPET
jgi:excisionase family DNA binding protein